MTILRHVSYAIHETREPLRQARGLARCQAIASHCTTPLAIWFPHSTRPCTLLYSRVEFLRNRARKSALLLGLPVTSDTLAVVSEAGFEEAAFIEDASSNFCFGLFRTCAASVRGTKLVAGRAVEPVIPTSEWTPVSRRFDFAWLGSEMYTQMRLPPCSVSCSVSALDADS